MINIIDGTIVEPNSGFRDRETNLLEKIGL